MKRRGQLKGMLLSESRSEKSDESNSTTVWKRKTVETVKKISGCQEFGTERRNRRNTEDVQGRDTLLCETAVVATDHLPFDKTRRMYKTKSDSSWK